MANCFELSLLPAVDASEFERFLWNDFFPNFQILRRNVRQTRHRLLKLDATDSMARYVWLVFAEEVGSTPETAGEGPEVLASDLNWESKAAQALLPYATISTFTEVAPLSAQASV